MFKLKNSKKYDLRVSHSCDLYNNWFNSQLNSKTRNLFIKELDSIGIINNMHDNIDAFLHSDIKKKIVNGEYYETFSV
jgi:hypothetical protein